MNEIGPFALYFASAEVSNLRKTQLIGPPFRPPKKKEGKKDSAYRPKGKYILKKRQPKTQKTLRLAFLLSSLASDC